MGDEGTAGVAAKLRRDPLLPWLLAREPPVMEEEGAKTAGCAGERATTATPARLIEMAMPPLIVDTRAADHISERDRKSERAVLSHDNQKREKKHLTRLGDEESSGGDGEERRRAAHHRSESHERE